MAKSAAIRGTTGSIARIHYDLEYIEKWSLPLDARIIVRTIWHEFLFGHGN